MYLNLFYMPAKDLASARARVMQRLHNKWLLRLMLWWRLPGAAFFGFRVSEISEAHCRVELPMRWRSQNPFRSIYFAAQCAAAEFTSGALMLVAIAGRPPVSMLVTDMQGTFIKKAKSKTTFTCSDGAALTKMINEACLSGQPGVCAVDITATLEDGTVVSTFKITWQALIKPNA